MAAAQAQLNNYLQNNLGIAHEVCEGLNNEGLQHIDDYKDMSDDDIDNLCDSMRKAVAPNDGIRVGQPVKLKLKKLAYFMRYLERVQRPFAPNQASLANLNSCHERRKLEKDYDNDINEPEKLTTVDKIRETIENIDNYFNRKMGRANIPLAYIVRDDPNVVPHGDPNDPGLFQPTIVDELIQRASHTGVNFTYDNSLVWSALRAEHTKARHGHGSLHLRSSNGRDAYIAFKSHYLGQSFTSRIRTAAETTLTTSFFDGRRNFSLEKYCEVMQKAITDLDGTEDEVSGARQVREFLRGIRDPKLDNAKLVIMGDPERKESLSKTIDYISEVYTSIIGANATSTTRNRGVSSTTTGRPPFRGGRGRGRRPPNTARGRGRDGRFHNGRNGGRGRSSNITDRYYTTEEWTSLTREQQDQVRSLRSNRDRRRGMVASATTEQDERNVRTRIENTDATNINPPTNVAAQQNQTVASAITESSNPGSVLSRRRIGPS